MSKSDYAPVNGAELFHQVHGSGEPVLLLHAGVADSRMWQKQFEAFSDQLQLISYDMRGFGRSEMPAGPFCNYEDARGVLDHLGIEKAIVMGISFGSAVALDLALAYPERVEALILGAPSVSGDQPSDRIKAFWDKEEAAFADGDPEKATRLNVEFWVDGPNRAPEQVESWIRALVYDMQLSIFQKAIPDDIDEVGLQPPAIGRLHAVAVPTLLLVGDQDLEEKQRLTAHLERAIPGSKRVVLPGVGHMLNMEHAAQFNGAVRRFLVER